MHGKNNFSLEFSFRHIHLPFSADSKYKRSIIPFFYYLGRLDEMDHPLKIRLRFKLHEYVSNLNSFCFTYTYILTYVRTLGCIYYVRVFYRQDAFVINVIKRLIIIV